MQTIIAQFTNSLRINRPLINSLQNRCTHSPKNQPHDDGTYKGEKLKRYGFEPQYHDKGLLPRLKLKEHRLRTMPISSKEDRWSKRQSTMGQNDFFNILGDRHINQEDLLEETPDYLKGYRSRNEYSVLMRKRHEFEHWKETKPLKHLHMQQRIKFLYRRLNNKYKPPDVEMLRPSRHQL